MKIMGNQCNLCGLKDDSLELILKNKTWCLVYDKEVDNKHQDCVHWKPDSPSIRSQNAFIAENIKQNLPHQSTATKKKKDSDLKITSSHDKTIWNEIKKDYDINKRAFGKKINFVTDVLHPIYQAAFFVVHDRCSFSNCSGVL